MILRWEKDQKRFDDWGQNLIDSKPTSTTTSTTTTTTTTSAAKSN